MASTFSPNLDLELMNTGEDNGIWGVKSNSNWGIVDNHFGGRLSLSVAGSSNVTLTTNQAENIRQTYTGALTGNIDVIFPDAGSFYIVENSTTGAFTLGVMPSGGTAAVIPQGTTALVFMNPDNGEAEVIAQISSSGVLPVAGGGTGASTASGARTNLGLGAAAVENLGGSVVDDGSGNLKVANSGVTAGSYTNASVTVGADGRVTAASSGDTAILSVKVQTFTGSGTYTPSAGMVYCWVRLQAPGGGSGGCASTSSGQATAAGAGGSGGYCEDVFTASQIGASQTVTIGARGTAASAGNNNGGTGGTTSLGSLLSSPGGGGGEGGGATVTFPQAGSTGGAGGVPTAGTVKVNGNAGGTAIIFGTSGNPNGALGAAPPWGGGVSAPSPSSGRTAATAALSYGAGASAGGLGASQSALAGAQGGPGIIEITEYCTQ